MTKKNAAARVLAPVLLVAVALMIASPNLQANADQPTAMADVKIDNFSFGPQSLTVKVGTIVTWTNRDDIPHTVVSSDGVFKSKARDTDESFSYKFDKAGTYPYFCSLHPKMTGQVVVQ
ncbi:MAG TPA: cupredoxin family copper-binding protein [Candidatus Binatia bacterium]|nr:cupredoxin family copper-binding protein [Candidatus Binatia bacterium]